MLTQIDVELNQWVEDVERVIKDGHLEHETIEDGTSSDAEVDIKQNKMKHVDAIKYFTLGLQWTEEKYNE